MGFDECRGMKELESVEGGGGDVWEDKAEEGHVLLGNFGGHWYAQGVLLVVYIHWEKRVMRIKLMRRAQIEMQTEPGTSLRSDC